MPAGAVQEEAKDLLEKALDGDPFPVFVKATKARQIAQLRIIQELCMIQPKRFFILLLLFSLQLLIFGCSRNDFKENSFKAKQIIAHAMGLLIHETSIDSNASGNVTVKNDNSKAISYLKNNNDKLKFYYRAIKANITKSNENYYDAIYVASYINELYYYLTGVELDDRCYYINLILNNEGIQLSNWLINDFFAPLNKSEEYKRSWLDLDPEKKRQIIFRILTDAKNDC